MNGITRLAHHVLRQRVLQDDDIAAQHVEGDAAQVAPWKSTRLIIAA
jgi:hypothetical protein